MSYQRIEQYDTETTLALASAYKDIINLVGENPEREGLQKTPERIAKAMQYLTQGYSLDANAILESAKFNEDVSEMVIVKDIELCSM